MVIVRALLLAACFFLFAQKALALPSTVRVRLFSAASESGLLTLSPPFRVLSPHPQVVTGSTLWYVDAGRSQSGAGVQIYPQNTKRASVNAGGGITGSAIVVAPLARTLTINFGKSSRKVQGAVTFALKNGSLSAVLKLPARDYVYGVVGSESLPEFSPPALRAQAVLVDTWLAHRQADEIIGDDTSDMAYLGADYARLEVVRAVDSVFPEVLVDKRNGHVIKAFFHSTCGGKLSLPSEIFSGESLAAGSTPAQPATCKYCLASPFCKDLTTRLSAKEVRAKLGFDIVEIVQRDSAGRPLLVAIEKDGTRKELSGYKLWLRLGQNFGWGKVPGMSYTVEREKDTYKLTSRGAGHGIGLCQWGAQGLSRAPYNKDYREILGYYFPQAQILSSKDRKRNK